MAATKKRNNGDYLPADLVTEILLKLPVKSIIRFESVAKNWYHLFKNPTFISQHSRLSEKNSTPSLIFNYTDPNYYVPESNSGHRIGMMKFANDKTYVSYKDLHQQLPCHVADNKITNYKIAAGDGLVCLFDFRRSGLMTLWNPATKEFRNLPFCNQFTPPPNRRGGRLPISAIHPRGVASAVVVSKVGGGSVRYFPGCGIGPLSNDYKILLIREKFISFKCSIYGYAIYRMSSDSWTVLKKEELQLDEDPNLKLNNTNVCINGVCYWHAIKREPSGRIDHGLCKLFKFHLDTEVFQLMEAPIPGSHNGKLMPLPDGRIAFWDSTNVKDNGITRDQCVIWVSNDEGNCWTKLINIDVPIGFRRMFGFWTHGTVFVESNESGEKWLYDLETGKLHNIGISPYFLYSYVESLLSVKSIKYIQKTCSPKVRCRRPDTEKITTKKQKNENQNN